MFIPLLDSISICEDLTSTISSARFHSETTYHVSFTKRISNWDDVLFSTSNILLCYKKEMRDDSFFWSGDVQ